MEIVVHPNKPLSDEQASIFSAFLEEEPPERVYWSKGSYRYKGNNIILEHEVVKRPRKKDKIGERYEFFLPAKSELIGAGGYASVFRVAATWVPQPESRFKLFGSQKEDGTKVKRRVVKIQYHTDRFPVEKAQKEYALASKVGDMGIKAPVIQGKTSFLFMRYQPGVTLFDFINAERTGKKGGLIKPALRLEISLAILEAYKKWVHDAGLIHRDLKPENVIVKQEEQSVKISIIDYGLSRLIAEDDGCFPGTVAYGAPEMFNQKPGNYKSDIYSLGRVIGQFWFADSMTDANIKEPTATELVAFAHSGTQQNLFRFLELSDTFKAEMGAILIKMVAVDPAARPEIDELIRLFKNIDPSTIERQVPQPAMRPIKVLTMEGDICLGLPNCGLFTSLAKPTNPNPNPNSREENDVKVAAKQ